MRILATNDDGVGAAGLWESVRVLRELGEVMVVAPSGDHSGAGAGILWHQRMAYRQIRSRRKGCEDVPTYIVYNTPAAGGNDRRRMAGKAQGGPGGLRDQRW